MNILDTIWSYLSASGFGQFHWTNLVMIGIGCLFLFLAIKKGFEPLLLVPIGFGILVGNIPYNSASLPLGVYDGPVSQHDLRYYTFDVSGADLKDGPYKAPPEQDWQWPSAYSIIDAEALGGAFSAIYADNIAPVDKHLEGMKLYEDGQAILVNAHATFAPREKDDLRPGIYNNGQGRFIVVPPRPDLTDEQAEALSDDSIEKQTHNWYKSNRFPQLWSHEKQDPFNASVFWYIFVGVGVGGFFPPLIFLGIGALTDFGPMLSNPKTLLLGAAAQFGIFGALMGALLLGFNIKEAASIGIIGGADGPTAIFTCSTLAPDLLGAVALAAYSYMAMVPIIQPPIIELLTTKKERLIRMNDGRPVSRRVKIIFPILGFILTAFIAPAGLPLLGMLFFGNLLRECLVTDRLSKTAQNQLIDVVTVLLGVTVGAKTSAANFLTTQTIYIFILGVAAFGLATAAGVLFGKLMNAVCKEPINPMIGAAGVSAVPMSARVVHRMGLDEDKQNFLLMHAMGPNVAGVIGSAVAAGVLLSNLAGK